MAPNTAYKDLLVDILHKQIPRCRIWLFGSRARQTHAPGADVDLALDAGRTLSLQEVADIKYAIGQSNIPVFVDIIDIRTISAEFLKNIQKEWIEWT